MPDKLYPQIVDPKIVDPQIVDSQVIDSKIVDPKQLLSLNQLNELTDNKLSKCRADEIKAKVNELKKDLTRYKKQRRNWKNASKVMHGIGVGVGVATGVAAATVAIVSTEGIAIPIAVPIALATIGAVETAISESIAIGLIKKKKHRYTEKINIVSSFINRMYMFYQRSIDDRKITIEELEEFHNIVNEYESEITKLQTKNTGVNSFNKLEHLAEVKAKKEYEIELLNKLTEQKKNNLKSKFNLN